MPHCDHCGRAVGSPYYCRACRDSHCLDCQKPQDHDCEGLKHQRETAQAEPRTSSSGTAGRQLDTDFSSPDLNPDGSLKTDSENQHSMQPQREQKSRSGNIPSTGWIYVKRFFTTLVSLVGFAMILYGAWSGFTKWASMGIAPPDIMTSVVALDLLIIFAGAGIVLIATR